MPTVTSTYRGYDSRLSIEENRRLAFEAYSDGEPPVRDPDYGSWWFVTGAWAGANPGEAVHPPSDHDRTRLRDIAHYWKLRVLAAKGHYAEAAAKLQGEIDTARLTGDETFVPSAAVAKQVGALKRQYEKLRARADEAVTAAGLDPRTHFETAAERDHRLKVDAMVQVVKAIVG